MGSLKDTPQGPNVTKIVIFEHKQSIDLLLLLMLLLLLLLLLFKLYDNSLKVRWIHFDQGKNKIPYGGSEVTGGV